MLCFLAFTLHPAFPLPQGTCLCGVCVCRPGWDGAADCSVPFSADGWAAFFATFPLYSGLYGGMSVVDQRALIESSQGTDNVTDSIPLGRSYVEMFPRLLFPRIILASTVNKTALALLQSQFLPQLNANLSYASPYIDSSTLLGDFTLQQYLRDPAKFCSGWGRLPASELSGRVVPCFSGTGDVQRCRSAASLLCSRWPGHRSLCGRPCPYHISWQQRHVVRCQHTLPHCYELQ